MEKKGQTSQLGDRNSSSMEDTLVCPVCLEIFLEPMLVECCGNTFCLECISACKNMCPFCQKKTGIQKNLLVKNIVEIMVISCGCGVGYKRKDKAKHLEDCVAVLKKCKFCQFEGVAMDRARHGIRQHLDIIIESCIEIIDL